MFQYLISLNLIVVLHGETNYFKSTQSINKTLIENITSQRKNVKNEMIDHLFNYTIFQPRVFNHNNRRRPLNTTKIKISHLDKISFKFFDKLAKLDYYVLLELAPFFWSSRFFINLDGNKKYYPSHKEMKESHCYYRGNVIGFRNSSAYFSTCKGLNGHINVNRNAIYIEPMFEYSYEENLNMDHIMYYPADIKQVEVKCATSDGVKNYDSDFRNESKQFRHKKSTDWNSQRPQEQNVFESDYVTSVTKYIGLRIVFDHKYYENKRDAEFLDTLSSLERNAKEIINLINHFYRKIGIQISLVNVDMWATQNFAHVDDNSIEETHKHFRLFDINFRQTDVDVSILITKAHHLAREGSVGYALRGSICSYYASSIVVREKLHLKHLVGHIVAHELAHVLGVPHDPDWLQCPSCLMNPYMTEETTPIHWSDYSKFILNIILLENPLQCLRDNLYRDVNLNCGNGIKSWKEECDCGLVEDCDTKCCNAATCKLTTNATCATGICCDLETCQIKKEGVECRPSKSCCDLPEFCNGVHESCPEDVYLYDGHPCQSYGEESFCYYGYCNTYSSRCRFIWGKGATKSQDICYKKNLKGGYNGHCIFNRFVDDGIKGCPLKNIMCGLLFCQGNQNAPNKYINELHHRNDKIGGKTCQSSVIGDSIRHSGMVPDGVKCGPQSMCTGNTCVNITIPLCNCAGNQSCTNIGTCYNGKPKKCPDVVMNKCNFINVSGCGIFLVFTMIFQI